MLRRLAAAAPDQQGHAHLQPSRSRTTERLAADGAAAELQRLHPGEGDVSRSRLAVHLRRGRTAHTDRLRRRMCFTTRPPPRYPSAPPRSPAPGGLQHQRLAPALDQLGGDFRRRGRRWSAHSVQRFRSRCRRSAARRPGWSEASTFEPPRRRSWYRRAAPRPPRPGPRLRAGGPAPPNPRRRIAAPSSRRIRSTSSSVDDCASAEIDLVDHRHLIAVRSRCRGRRTSSTMATSEPRSGWRSGSSAHGSPACHRAYLIRFRSFRPGRSSAVPRTLSGLTTMVVHVLDPGLKRSTQCRAELGQAVQVHAPFGRAVVRFPPVSSGRRTCRFIDQDGSGGMSTS